MSILLFNSHHAPNGTNAVDFVTGLRPGDHSLVFIDPMVNHLAALREHADEVLGLPVIGRALCGGDMIDGGRRPGVALMGIGQPRTPIS
jgi:hypothetical protein